jgi:hypothetical protein
MLFASDAQVNSRWYTNTTRRTQPGQAGFIARAMLKARQVMRLRHVAPSALPMLTPTVLALRLATASRHLRLSAQDNGKLRETVETFELPRSR